MSETDAVELTAVETPLGVLIVRADKVEETKAHVDEFITYWGDRYNLANLQRLYDQRPKATELHTFPGWRAAGRQVRRGEKAIKLMAPKGVKIKGNLIDPETGESKDTLRIRPIALFDIGQTDEIAEETAA